MLLALCKYLGEVLSPAWVLLQCGMDEEVQRVALGVLCQDRKPPVIALQT